MNVRRLLGAAAALAALAVGPAPCEGAEAPWPAPVKGHVAVKPGEHPRLFFRKSDIAELKKRAATPEGKAVVARLKALLGGGEAMPARYSPAKSANDKVAPKDVPEGTYTTSHAAGFGLLYQLTGDKKYADLGKQCFEKAWDGVRDRDARYSWKEPGGALRAGPSLGAYAVGYDLCYDGWDEAFRKKAALALQNYDQGKFMTLAELARGSRHKPGSNHWGPQVGGAALALLAIQGDPGVDDKQVQKLLDANAKAVVRQLTEGWGDHGWFDEGDGPGTISSDTAFVPALQAWRVAGGKDFVTPRPNAPWMTLKWVMLTVPAKGKPAFPIRGGYPHNVWSRVGMSGSGTFSQGFGAVPEEYKPALLWTYNHCVSPGKVEYDTVSPYPLRAVLALVNWPIGAKEKNPGDVLPRVVEDKSRAFYMFRNRWQDEDDIVVTAHLRDSRGGGRVDAGPVLVLGLGKRTQFPVALKGTPTYFQATKTGGVVSTKDQSFAVDFSRASGADALLVMVGGKGGKGGTRVTAGGREFTVMTLQKGAAPAVKVDGDKVVVGGQTITFDGKNVVLAK